MFTRQQPAAVRRRAVSVLEAAAALVILAGVMVLTAKVLSVVARQQQSSSQLLVAQLEAANVLERISLVSDEEFNTERLGQFKLSPEAQAALPEAELKVSLGEPPESDAAGMRSVRVELTWSPGPDLERSVTLTGWR